MKEVINLSFKKPIPYGKVKFEIRDFNLIILFIF